MNKLGRSKNYYKRKRQLRRTKAIVSITIFILSSFLIFAICGFSTNAQSKNQLIDYKYYSSYCIEENDNLWNIATEYYNSNHYDSIQDYIDEICIVNNMSEDTILYEGFSIIVPYYSNEFK